MTTTTVKEYRSILDPLTRDEEVACELRRLAREKAEAEEAAREQAAYQRELETQLTLDAIDKALSPLPLLAEALKEQNQAIRLSEQQRADINRFQEAAKEWKLSALPAAPQLVAAFLVGEDNEEDPSETIRLHDSISALHKATNFPDPTNDVLVRAFMSIVRKDLENQRKEQNGDLQERP